MTSVRQAVSGLERKLGNRMEAEVLVAFGIGRERSWLYGHPESILSPDQLKKLNDLADRRAAGQPVAYLTGQREFYGRSFRVSPAVLIPRPETEMLVDQALALDLPRRARVLDMGTGSGCIALSLAAERPEWQITATDLSTDALAVAADNRQQMNLDRVELLAGDLFVPVRDRSFDLIISNPPYVAATDPHLERGDLPAEPRLALTPGGDGLSVIARMLAAAPSYLSPAGWLIIEHGHDQGSRVRKLFLAAGFEQVKTCDDLAKLERLTMGCKNQAER